MVPPTNASVGPPPYTPSAYRDERLSHHFDFCEALQSQRSSEIFNFAFWILIFSVASRQFVIPNFYGGYICPTTKSMQTMHIFFLKTQSLTVTRIALKGSLTSAVLKRLFALHHFRIRWACMTLLKTETSGLQGK